MYPRRSTKPSPPLTVGNYFCYHQTGPNDDLQIENNVKEFDCDTENSNGRHFYSTP